VCAAIILDAALQGCSARFPLNNIRSSTASTVVTTRSMAHDRRYATGHSHKNRKAVCHGNLFTRRSTPAAKPYLQNFGLTQNPRRSKPHQVTPHRHHRCPSRLASRCDQNALPLSARLVNRRVALDAAANLAESSLCSFPTITSVNPSSAGSPVAGRVVNNISPRPNLAKWTCHATNCNHGDASRLPPSPRIVRRCSCLMSSAPPCVDEGSDFFFVSKVALVEIDGILMSVV
jgi:hypothetical protein